MGYIAPGLNVRRFGYVGNGAANRLLNCGIVPKFIFVIDPATNNLWIAFNGNDAITFGAEIVGAKNGAVIDVGTAVLAINANLANYILYVFG